MGCGGSVNSTQRGKTELREREVQLQRRRSEIDAQDDRMQREADRLVRTVEERDEEAAQMERLRVEVAASAQTHTTEMRTQREHLSQEHTESLRAQIEFEEQVVDRKLAEANKDEQTWYGQKLEEDVEATHEMYFEMKRREEKRCAEARLSLQRARDEVLMLEEERQSAIEATLETKEAYLAQRRAIRRQNEVIIAEVRTQATETEAMHDASRSLEAKTRLLQAQLSEMSFTIGQRDHELRAQEMELHAVQKGIHSFEDQVDEMKICLSEQCNRVQQVESSWHRSDDLHAKVGILRAMLTESHETLNFLRDGLESERQRRDVYARSYKEQRARNEMLLQMLQHFKTRNRIHGDADASPLRFS